MKIGKVQVPPVCVKEHRAVAKKAKELFTETHEQVGKPRLDIDTTLDIWEVVLKKLKMWRKSENYKKEVNKFLDIKA